MNKLFMLFFISQSISVTITIIVNLITKSFFHKKIENYTINDTSNTVKQIKNIKEIRVIILIAVYIIANIISCSVIVLTDISQNLKYDMFGNSYLSGRNIPFYDESGKKYFYYRNENSIDSYYISEDNNYYNTEETYITKGGYIVFLEKERIESYIGIYEIVYDDGEHYYSVLYPYWNEEGDLIVDGGGGLFGNESIIITKEEQELYRKEHSVTIDAG